MLKIQEFKIIILQLNYAVFENTRRGLLNSENSRLGNLRVDLPTIENSRFRISMFASATIKSSIFRNSRLGRSKEMNFG